jgi:hypothetical protein
MSNGAVVKTLNLDSHVAVVKNINNVVVNKLANLYKIRENASFFFAKKLRVYMF